jgi:hypothetical protein
MTCAGTRGFFSDRDEFEHGRDGLRAVRRISSTNDRKLRKVGRHRGRPSLKATSEEWFAKSRTRLDFSRTFTKDAYGYRRY